MIDSASWIRSLRVVYNNEPFLKKKELLGHKRVVMKNWIQIWDQWPRKSKKSVLKSGDKESQLRVYEKFKITAMAPWGVK